MDRTKTWLAALFAAVAILIAVGVIWHGTVGQKPPPIPPPVTGAVPMPGAPPRAGAASMPGAPPMMPGAPTMPGSPAPLGGGGNR